MKHKLLLLIALMSMLALLTGPAAAQGPVAAVQISPDQVTWLPQIGDYSSITLTVAGPKDFHRQQTFPAGSAPTFSRPPFDGPYTYELVVTPALDPGVAQALAAATEENRDEVVAQLSQSGQLPPPLTQSGSFLVSGGKFVTDDGGEGGIGIQDVVVADDQIVQGSLCVGFDCVNNESFGFDTIRLKENNTRIKFEDTSSTSGFPTHDWQLTANDSASGGAEKFSIEDITAGRIPFTIEGDTPTNSLYIDSIGRIGLGTATPVLQLHIADGNTPGVRLDQDGTGGWGTYVWDVAGNETNFFVRDVTGGSRLPFKIKPGAPNNSLVVAASGDVGVGTLSPTAKLHVTGNVLIEGSVTEFSSVEAKENFTPVDQAEVLKRLANLPLSTWNYKADGPAVRHIGPVAQDFYAAFGLGQDDEHIAPLDTNGVALAAVQALAATVEAQEAQLTELQQQNRDLQARLDALEKLVETLSQE